MIIILHNILVYNINLEMKKPKYIYAKNQFSSQGPKIFRAPGLEAEITTNSRLLYLKAFKDRN